jgi:hypothetical protein
MEFKEDIVFRIRADFKDTADEVMDILSNAILKTDYLKTDRIIRCIVFLSNGKIEKLGKYINSAINDPRDVMLWAEYEDLENKSFKFKRERNFNMTFEWNEDVK